MRCSKQALPHFTTTQWHCNKQSRSCEDCVPRTKTFMYPLGAHNFPLFVNLAHYNTHDGGTRAQSNHPNTINETKKQHIPLYDCRTIDDYRHTHHTDIYTSLTIQHHVCGQPTSHPRFRALRLRFPNHLELLSRIHSRAYQLRSWHYHLQWPHTIRSLQLTSVARLPTRRCRYGLLWW